MNIFPEAICCLPTSYIYAVLLEFCYVCIRLATIANMGHFLLIDCLRLFVVVYKPMLFTHILPEAICCCVETCNV